MSYLLPLMFGLAAMLQLLPMSESAIGVCTRTQYRSVVGSPTSYRRYEKYERRDYYSCGFLWLSQCSRSRGYGSRSVVRYQTGYMSQRYTEQYCCTGYTGRSPNCELITCPILSSPSNGDVSHSSNLYNSRACYSCDTGYERLGSRCRTCLSSGRWSDSPPSCRAVRCPTAHRPSYGYVSCTSNFYSGICQYSCHSGYRLVGTSTLTCNSYGRWSGSQPTCKRITCPHLYNPDNGAVTVDSYYPSGIGTYSCQYGYRLVGLLSVQVCQSDGTWTEPAPRCKLGYAQRSCQQNGEWSGSQPVCIEKCAMFVGFELPFLRIKEGETKLVCLANCSSCALRSNLTVEIKARYQEDGLEENTDITLPPDMVITENSTNCFEILAINDKTLEGSEHMSLVLFKPDGQDYRICPDNALLPIIIIDSEELIIEFDHENNSICVSEGVGFVEICLRVTEPDPTVPVPDVILDAKTVWLGEAKPGDDYVKMALSLPLSDTARGVCFNVTIIDDYIFEEDEEFSILVDRESAWEHNVPLTFDQTFTIKILDNDGITVGFSVYEMSVDEGSVEQVCIEARFPSSYISDSFSLAVISRELTAAPGRNNDYEDVNSRVGPFTYSSQKNCFDLTIHDDSEAERKEQFTLEITQVPPLSYWGNLLSWSQSILTKMMFPHCTDCEYPHVCREWEEKPDSKVKVPKEKCLSRGMYVEECWKNATKGGANCKPRQEVQTQCVQTTGQRMMPEMGAGSMPGTKSPAPNDNSPRERRQAEGYCYEPENALSLDPHQCNAFNPSQCPYASNEIKSRDSDKECSNRSVLFVLDASYSVGYELFKEASSSLSYFVKHLCGDVQFGLMKYSSAAYLEFCFDCFENNEREELQSRIINTKYLGHSSFTGYATRCVNSFMFDSSCGNHDGRCIDIVFVTDGESSDSAFINVCDQVECLHRNPMISDKLQIYVLNMSSSAVDELKCITKYSNKMKNGQPPIFSFGGVEDLIKELNTVVLSIAKSEDNYNKNGKKPKDLCFDWSSIRN